MSEPSHIPGSPPSPGLRLQRAGCTHVDLHLAVEPVVEQQVVRHADTVRLHRVTLPVVVVPDVA